MNKLQSHTKTWKWGRAIFLLPLMWPLLSNSQITVQNGANAPTEAIRTDWYLDTLAHEAWVRQDGEWTKFFLPIDPVEQIQPCHNDVLLFTKGGDGVAEREGRSYIHTIQCTCKENAVMFTSVFTLGFIRDNNTIAWAADKNYFAKLLPGGVILDSINGKPYYCMTNASDVPDWVRSESELHYWGLIDSEGQWIIEPKFDFPFKFENGIATVSYYGVIHTINTKGEFVD